MSMPLSMVMTGPLSWSPTATRAAVPLSAAPVPMYGERRSARMPLRR